MVLSPSSTEKRLRSFAFFGDKWALIAERLTAKHRALPSRAIPRQIWPLQKGEKKAKKRLHKSQSSHYKCGHEYPMPLYFIRRAGCTRPDELAAKHGACRGAPRGAGDASRAGRQGGAVKCSAPSGGRKRHGSSRHCGAHRNPIPERVDVQG